MATKHTHRFIARRPNASVMVCNCGKFQHVITDQSQVIVEHKPIDPVLARLIKEESAIADLFKA
jgi:hypothetical protein